MAGYRRGIMAMLAACTALLVSPHSARANEMLDGQTAFLKDRKFDDALVVARRALFQSLQRDHMSLQRVHMTSSEYNVLASDGIPIVIHMVSQSEDADKTASKLLAFRVTVNLYSRWPHIVLKSETQEGAQVSLPVHGFMSRVWQSIAPLDRGILVKVGAAVSEFTNNNLDVSLIYPAPEQPYGAILHPASQENEPQYRA
jgi:hypothetical protein